jgi:predicted O-methyltransferase YrrM
MIFVDADHTEEPAKQDIEDSLHCLTSEGFVVAHDIIQPSSEHIEKICSDLAQAHGKQFVAYKQGNGLGIIF